jgi:DNA-binding Lrp family transcriptional regulator
MAGMPSGGRTAPEMPEWTFLSSHARVLLSIARDPEIRLREIGEQVGITERAAHRIVSELVDAGYLARERHGRRNRYAIRHDLPLPDEIARSRRIGDLLEVLIQADPPTRHEDRRLQSSTAPKP